MSDDQDPGPSADAETLTELRGEGPRVVRLSRKAIAIACGVGLALAGGALLYALKPVSRAGQEELFNTESVAITEGLATAPRDYSQIPELGPPLPGDLGKPILDAQDRGAVAALPEMGAQPPPPQGPSPQEAARQRLQQERDAARTSQLFLEGATTGPVSPEAAPGSAGDLDAPPPATSTGPALAQPAAEPRIAALQPIEAGPSTTRLQAGSVIPAALITGIRSDQPGLVTAQVTENVYDSLTGRRLLIAQGARLVGEYESDVAFGQRRVMLVWNRLILNDGRSLELDRQPAADAAGYAGLEDHVDYHWGRIFRGAVVSALLGVGSALGSERDSELVRALRRSGQESIGRTGEQVVARELGIRPTLAIRPGFRLRVLVTRDIDFGDVS